MCTHAPGGQNQCSSFSPIIQPLSHPVLAFELLQEIRMHHKKCHFLVEQSVLRKGNLKAFYELD